MASSGSRFAEEILPEEVWGKIFSNLTNSDDVMRCYQTCRLFQSLLKTSVYSQAFEVLLANVSGSKQQLSEKDLLSCRLVSPEWQGVVDHFAQSYPTRLDLSCYRLKSIGNQGSFADQADHPRNRFGSILLEYHKLDKAFQLVQEITENARVKRNLNSLVGRHLVIAETSVGRRETPDEKKSNKTSFYNIVSQLLQSCGEHIWYLTIGAWGLDNLPEWFLNIIWKWLRLLPNLKMITCQMSVDYMEKSKKLEMLNQLQVGVAQQPFPHLPHLVTLQLNGVPDIVLHSAMNVNRQVKRLEIVQSGSTSVPLNFTRWKHTSLTECCITIGHMEDFYSLTSSDLPLEKLTINFALDPEFLSQVGKCMGRLGHFGKTLKYLRIEMSKMVDEALPIAWQLQLPRLEELHLHVVNQVDLAFIAPMKSLRVLKLSVLYCDRRGDPRVRYFDSSTSMTHLEECRIWEFSSALRKIQVQVKFRVKRSPNGKTKARNPINKSYYRQYKFGGFAKRSCIKSTTQHYPL